jgi:broad specificity phosphatase PhoE
MSKIRKLTNPSATGPKKTATEQSPGLTQLSPQRRGPSPKSLRLLGLPHPVAENPNTRDILHPPLTRCLQTANITFSTLDLPSGNPFTPTVKELFREGISSHTCDRRGTKTYIHNAFPSYKIEAGFSEDDLLWKPLQGEVPTDEDIRSKKVIDDVFGSGDSTWISITSHSGEIASILRGESFPFTRSVCLNWRMSGC